MNMTDMITRINDFGKSIAGDPEQHLRNYIKQNNIPQEALDYAQQQANSIYQAMRTLGKH